MKYNLEKLENWFQENIEPDFKQFEHYREVYVKLWIDPWIGLDAQNPPLSYFSSVLDHFIKLYDHWFTAFQTYGKPFDLQLWLFEAKYRQIELVSASVEQHGDQRNNYFIKARKKNHFQNTLSIRPYLNLKISNLNYFMKSMRNGKISMN